jgi:hypothetical protein
MIMTRIVPSMPRDDQPVPAELNLHCTDCGYSLTGLLERRCPECGEPFDPRETWLENERNTWEFHFQHVRTKGDYARIGLLGLLMVLFLLTAFSDAKALLAFPLIVFGELYIYYTGSKGLTERLLYWSIAAVWGVIMAVL